MLITFLVGFSRRPSAATLLEGPPRAVGATTASASSAALMNARRAAVRPLGDRAGRSLTAPTFSPLGKYGAAGKVSPGVAAVRWPIGE